MIWGFSGVLAVKNPPAVQESQETRVWSLGQEDPLEEGMATHSSILALRIPMDRRAWQTKHSTGMVENESQFRRLRREEILTIIETNMGFPGGASGKEPAC